MAEYDDLVEILSFLLTRRFQQKMEFTRGLLGDGLGNVDVPGRDGFSYVRPDRNSNKIFEMFNKTAFAADGTPILIGEFPWQPNLQQVVGIDWDTYLTVGWANRFAGIAQHGDTHVWRDGFIGEDPFTVYRRQIFDLRCEPLGSGSTSVIVTPYGINDNGTFKSWPGSPGLDLSAAIPSTTGTIRNALVYWDYSGDTSYGVLGVATGTLSTVSETSLPPKPVEPVGTIPSAYVELQGGQTQIKEEDIKDARPILSVATVGDDEARVSKVYESDFENVALYSDADGNIIIDDKLGLGTATIPHASVGNAKLAIEGPDSDTDGPHIQFTTDTDDYPIIQILPYSHDSAYISFDAYFQKGTGWISSDLGSAFQLQKSGDEFAIRYSTLDTPGTILSWQDGVLVNTAGEFGVSSKIFHIGDTDTRIDFTTDDINLEAGGNTNQLQLVSTGNVLVGAGDLIVSANIVRSGDTDTYFSLTSDDIEMFAGGLSMLKLTESTQDLVTLGPGSGDVDIDFNGDMFLLGSTGGLGINTQTPTFTEEGASQKGYVYIERTDTSGYRGVVLSSISNSAGRNAQNEFIKARVGPAAVQSGDRVGDFYWGGHDGTDYNRSARFSAIVDGSVSANTVPMAFAIDTSETNSGGFTERFRIASNGDVGIGTSSPSGQLHVDQPSTTATQPVLYLGQADISEPLVQIETTIGTGNTVEAVGAKTLTPTHFVKLELPGGLIRYWEVGTIA